MTDQDNPEYNKTLKHNQMANAIRALSMDAVEKANSGHPGMPLGMADVATVLFSEFLKFDSSSPTWADRDRFVLSAGHGSMLLYSLLFLTGYKSLDIEDIKSFRQLGSKTAGHPEHGEIPGIEVTTGPLGQGLSTAVGLALAEKNMSERFGGNVVDHRTYVVAGDGCLMEGISQEAISFAGHLKLNKLTVLYDSNQISIDGPTGLSFSDNSEERFAASGWSIYKADGHDQNSIFSALKDAVNSTSPSLVICNTTIGFGSPNKAGSASSHGAPLGADEIQGTRESLNWPHEPFAIPGNILKSWEEIGAKGRKERELWESRVKKLDPKLREDFERLQARELPKKWLNAMQLHKQYLIKEKPSWATRVASQKAIECLAQAIPELIGGSADLTGSNGTKVDCMEIMDANKYDGRYIHYGVREHGMAAIMNGLALHGGVIPYGGTFLVFSDYCRPAIRLSALMKQQVIYVMTHDSIGLGEDGPTHQPVEHLASLRAIPGIHVMRPADAMETAECWEIAISRQDGPSIIALTRQGVPLLRQAYSDNNLSGHGAYEIGKTVEKNSEAVIFATGSEVAIAINAQSILEKDGIEARVVSVPCWELFEQQNDRYIKKIIGNEIARVAVEAGVSMGWERFVGSEGKIVGMRGFGASGPAKDLYNHFRITEEEIVKKVHEKLKT